MLRREKKKSKKILSDKIVDSLTVGPSGDVEDDHVFGTKPKTVTRDDLDSDGDSREETALSSFRKQNAELLSDISKRYAGEVTSKKALGLQNDDAESGSDDDFDVDSDDVADDSDEQEGSVDKYESGDSIEEEQMEGEEEMEEDNDEEEVEDEATESSGDDVEGSEEGFNISEMMEGAKEEQDNFKHFKPKNVSEEVAKGRCVKNQLDLWETMLEMRISLQRCLGTANRMPQQETFKALKRQGGDEFNILANKAKGSTVTLLARLLDLQELLLTQFPETKNLLSNKQESVKKEEEIENSMDEEIPSDEEISSESDNEGKSPTKPTIEAPVKINKKRKLEDYSNEIAERHTKYTKYRNNVIQTWNDKTKVIGQKKDQPTVSILSQIDYILGDKNKLIRRTQLKRSKYDILGEEKKEEVEEMDQDCDKPEDVQRKDLDNEYCQEIFDDDDYYHQLLRELIEHKSADISDPIQLSRQWIMLQQIRSKMKRKVDTRATKGRRIRYAVHNKLVNFMAPEVNHEWTDEMKDELYASLFGKQFENNIANGSVTSKDNVNGGFSILKS